ncbi:hypothetical protein SDRG_08214 [Saprolegnia diclina VS20]|uniref:Uncharacterized protein n=1 Tax=Saprolegnia diclina (strain VS20) TaxID=1156394 RepID=T0QKX1_SAPDV|nr:hypothetical protein SDRG_08214 [Saprolegnia diclina VS20]EQC34445.1 hypothetical protein SDRG_08214 [Saprolegnia diclina VS20]|eukprot:XP_008612307.1 hypothetical protein SDRG_08214 [Saprolegnia diclina VS20]
MLKLATSALSYHACSVKRPAPITVPHIRVQGLDEELLWPLPPHQVAALHALYSSGTSIVILCDMLFEADSDAIYEHEDDADLDGVVDRLDQSDRAVIIALDKLVIDTTGDAEAWKPMSTHASLFGTMAVTLPSDAVGGAVTISYENRTTSWDTVDDCVLGFHDTCSVHVAPITSGARTTLFIRVAIQLRGSDDDDDDDDDDNDDDDDDDERDETPMLLPTRAEMMDAVAATHTYKWVVIDMRIDNRGASSSCSLDAMTGCLRNAVEYLVSTGVLDVAFVYPNEVSQNVLFHPACHVPASVVAAATRKRLQRFTFRELNMARGQITMVFWPKAHRVYFVGLETAISLLTSHVAGGSTDLVGFATLRELASATIHTLCKATRALLDLRMTSDDWANLSAFVVNHGDVDLAMDFLWHVGDHYWKFGALTIRRDWLRVLVARCGWRTVLGPFIRIIQRSYSYSYAGTMLMDLVAGLVENNRLCVRQHHATEFLASALEELLQVFLCQSGNFLQNALCVSLCLTAESADPLVGGALAQRLPLPLVEHIDSFGAPRYTLADALLWYRSSFQYALPSVLLALLPSFGVLALQPFITIALQLFGPSEYTLYDNGIVALLQLTHGTTSFDAALDIALASNMKTAHWTRFLQTTALQLAPAHAARLLAHVTARFDATVVTPLHDTDEVCKLTSDAPGAVWICAHFDDTPGLAELLAYAKALEAAHEAPITVIMDVIVPFHDQAVNAGHSDFARTLAAIGLPQLTARLAALSAPTIARERSSKRCRWCPRYCDEVADFARSSRRVMYVSDKVARTMCVPLRRYPEHVGDVCWAELRNNQLVLVNNTDELVAKMRDAATRLESSLTRPPKRPCSCW